jgi:hypothetical protein
MAAPSSGALTTAGYTLASGVYGQTFGSIVVSFNISDEPDSGFFTINPNGAPIAVTDVANVVASLTALGYNVASVPLSTNGTYSQSI